MDTNAWYEFTDQNGERHVSRGDNGYIQQSINQGIPIYVNDKGEWFTEPYLELTPNGYVSHIPAWFKGTEEYTRWNNEFVPQMATTSVTKDVWENYKDVLRTLGAQGALRQEVYKWTADAGIDDIEEKKQAYNDYLSIILEGAGQGEAKLNLLEEAGVDASVADIARKYKELSKEALSEQMTGLKNIIDAKSKGKWDQGTTRSALMLYKLLNIVADNPNAYGKDNEFEGILEASEWQKFQAHVNSTLQTMAEGMPLFTWIARGVAGANDLATGNGPGFRIENYRENGLYNKYTGDNLRGVEGSIVSGNVLGSVENIAATIAESMIFGKFLDAKIAAGSSGSILAKVGRFSKTFGGSMVYDWFAHDLPIDLSLFATDLASGMSAGDAWYDDSKTQPLFGLFGPEVPYGLAMNLTGDAIMDLAIPVLGITGGAIWDSLDDVSGGALNKIRENVAVKNLAIQQGISDMPVIGTGLRKFSDWLFGAENTALIREARKASIKAGSTSFYADAQNLLTLKNHYGAEVVAPLYRKMVDDLNINEQIKKFNRNASRYGGFGKTKVEWDTAKGGVARHFSEIVDDDIPKQVKQGLLDYQRLEELRGEAELDGLATSLKREKEIAELEKKVEALPADIKKFASDMSELNKRVEQMMVGLGLTTQDLIDTLNADPRWKNYMTRQTLIPGGSRGSGAYDPATNKLLTGKRTGYYNPDQTLSPVMSLDMKVHAIGNAYAWNERAKALVGMELVQGKITAGDKSIDIAKQIREVRNTIAMQEATAAKLGYDTIVSGLSDRMINVGSTIRKLNEKLGSLENITVKSAFTGSGTGPSPEIKGFKADFESGKIQISDNTLVELDLSPADGASIFQNTYTLRKGDATPTKTDIPKTDIPRTESPAATPVREEVELTPLLGQDKPEQFSQKMFHGSGKAKSEIYTGAEVPILGEGKYWAFNEKGAKNFGDKVETSTVTIERPLVISSDDEWRNLTKQAGWEFPNPVGLSEEIMKRDTAALKKLVTDSGYDGVVINVAKSQDGLLRDVFSIDQAISYKAIDDGVAAAENIPAPKMATDADYPGFKINARDDGNSGKLRLLDESNPKFSREGTARDYYRDWKGRELRVLEMSPSEYDSLMARDGRSLNPAERDRASFYTKKFENGERVDIPYIDYDNNWKISGQEGRHRAVGAEEAGIEKIPVIIDYPRGEALPDFLGKYNDVTDSFVIRNNAETLGDVEASTPTNTVGRGISNDGVPFEFEIDGDNRVIRLEPLSSNEAYAESINSFKQGIEITPEHVGIMGQTNSAAINRALTIFRDNGLILPGRNTGVVSYTWVPGAPGKGSYGYSPYTPELRVENGKVVGKSEIRLNTQWYGRGKENALQKQLDYDVSTKWHPANSNKVEGTPAHELMHDMMKWLAIQEFNADVARKAFPADMLKSLADTESRTFIRNTDGSRRFASELEVKIQDQRMAMEGSIVDNALRRMGYDNPTAQIRNKEIEKYSRYARTKKKQSQIIAEAITEGFEDYIFNGNNAQELSKAIVAEVSDRLKRYQTVASPAETLRANGLDTPNRMLKNGEYAFPAYATSDADKAKWLDSWRQKNPYLKGEFTDETFQKANLWDSFFQKEIRAYDSASTSVSPDALIIKSGKFLEDYKANIAKEMVEEVKKLSVGEFDSDLAMMVLGRNSADIAEAMDNFIIRQIQSEAENLAKNMDGGATPENINTALITLWSDQTVKESTISMLNGFMSGGETDVKSKVDNLFDTQAKGLAAYEAMPLDTKQLLAEKEVLLKQLRKENKKVMKDAAALDKNSSFIDGGTHLIHYREGGENVYVAVNDPVVATMLERPYNFKENGIISETVTSIANFMATTYRLGTTGVNPLALVRNILRDPIQAMATAGFNPLSMTLSPEVFYKTLRQYGLDDDTINTVTNRIRSWAQSGTMTQEMRLGPGKFDSTYNSKVDEINKRLRNVSNGKLFTTLQTPLETWEGFLRNQIGQQSFVKNFKRTGDVDKALGSALMDTSNATTNFSHSIGKLKRATSTIPYLSSAINGTVSFWRLFNMDPIGMTTRIVGGFMVPVMAITAWNLSSDENRAVYETLPEWFKQGHLVLVDPQGNVLAVPLPEEIQQFSGTARKLIEYTQEATPFALSTIAAQGAFGFVPFEIDGFFADDGSINVGRGVGQMLSGIMPQAFTTIYEVWAKEDLFTGQDLSNMDWWNQLINAGTNMFGTGFKNVVNSIGIMCGVPEKTLIGYSFQNNLARDLFGMGFNAARDQFNAIVGSPSKVTETGEEVKSTGLFAENEELQRKIKVFDAKIATASDDEKAEYEKQKQELINNFIGRVENLMNNYQRLFQVTGGLEQWQKARLVQILTLGNAYSSANDDSYQAANSNQAYLDERGLAIQRYQQIGLPSGPTMDNLAGTDSFDIQAAVNRFYGVNKQATQDYRNAINSAGVKEIRDEFYDAISKIYDYADANGVKPDYDLIEKIQARYLQAMDSVLIPIINQYGINVLNNNDFLDAVRRQVNGMIPSDDWRQSTKNAKKFLSTKEFPTATVDVKKWLKNRYSSGMRDRGLSSDPEVTRILNSIKDDIDAGRTGAAKGKIESLRNGINKANYYISSIDFQTLTEYNNMVK